MIYIVQRPHHWSKLWRKSFVALSYKSCTFVVGGVLRDGSFVEWKAFSQGEFDHFVAISHMHQSLSSSKSDQIYMNHQFAMRLCFVSTGLRGSATPTLCFHIANPLTMEFMCKLYVINFMVIFMFWDVYEIWNLI